jgi:ketosteroid isomerase-like protein
MSDAEESNRQIIREAFEAWRDGSGAIADVFAPDIVWPIEGHSLASREYRSASNLADPR